MAVTKQCARIIREGVREGKNASQINTMLKDRLGVTVQASTISAFRTKPEDRTPEQKRATAIRKG